SERVVKGTLKRRIRSKIGDLGARAVRDRIAAYQLAKKLEQGGACSGFTAFGKYFGFSDILGCIEFLGRYLLTSPKKVCYAATSYSRRCETSFDRQSLLAIPKAKASRITHSQGSQKRST